ncbi:hypothetical protein DCCM_3075 [Desulfocucumis palustris]|uniref:CARDB domain-containing protein n=1 Tax=Desulfocucumis palustris TaxID=1898651 RepID=A0A2L2XD76_9FIRM|nr:hypothetical protein [Desulfocucumis palustris]GBF33964.1 hypothetical protein DCCM_3075 [Desulfocucumis palustris]
MMKRLTAVAAVFIFLTAVVPAFAEQLFNPQTAIENALNNGYYKSQNPDGDILNYVSIPILNYYLRGENYYGCLVYGQPHGDIKGDQYRYMGYTKFKPTPDVKEDYTNIAFPPDVTHTGYFEDQKWIIRPWWNGDVQAEYNVDFNNGLDGTDKYAKNINYGVMLYYNEKYNANNYQLKGVTAETRSFWENIDQYIHILAPPTEYAWGIGRMWRVNSSGGINYITVPISPGALLKFPDLSVKLQEDRFTDKKAGEKITSTVSYTLDADYSEEEVAWLRLHHVVSGQEYPIALVSVDSADTPNEKGHVVFKPGKTKTYQYTFTVQDRNTTILARINPADPYVQDKKWDNNRDEAPVTIVSACTDISVTGIKSLNSTVVGGRPEKFTATIKRANDGPSGNVAVKVTVTGSNGLKKEKTYSMAKGQTVQYSWVDTISNTITYTVQALPVGVEDCALGNNAMQRGWTPRTALKPPSTTNEIWISINGAK